MELMSRQSATYDAAVLTDVTRLHGYTGVCKALRNHIHDGILPVDQHPARSYGNSVSVALNLDAMPELAPGANNGMAQDHFDALGSGKPILPRCSAVG
jgi:hypothetical protein